MSLPFKTYTWWGFDNGSLYYLYLESYCTEYFLISYLTSCYNWSESSDIDSPTPTSSSSDEELPNYYFFNFIIYFFLLSFSFMYYSRILFISSSFYSSLIYNGLSYWFCSFTYSIFLPFCTPMTCNELLGIDFDFATWIFLSSYMSNSHYFWILSYFLLFYYFNSIKLHSSIVNKNQ